MKLSTKGLAASFGAAAAAVLLVSSPASAGTNAFVKTTDPFNGGAAGYHASNDTFTVCDNRADGLTASGHIGWSSRAGSYWIPVTDKSSGNACVRKKLNIPNGLRVSIKICLQGDRYCATKYGKS
ncbi:hypothetical protein ABT112_24205 [Streptomyces sp. NPDC002055]|uniref:hypothetical protein n=1 Tax=Streptomyces sp. NPDC002055 TaxID=3154534 RepID=UPI003321A63A